MEKITSNEADEEQCIKEYNDIISKMKQINLEADTLNESNASAIEKKLRDELFEANQFEPSKDVESEKIEPLKKLLEEGKKNLLANISNALAKQKKYDEAIKNEKRVMKLNASDPEPYKRILGWHLDNKKLEDASKFADEIRKKFEKEPTKLDSFKDIFANIEKYKKDEKAFLEKDTKPAAPEQKEGIKEYIIMILLAIVLRMIIRYFRKKKQPLPPTNSNPAKP